MNNIDELLASLNAMLDGRDIPHQGYNPAIEAIILLLEAERARAALGVALALGMNGR